MRQIDNRPDGTQTARVICVIETTSKRGLGTEKDPVRVITQYWDLNGKFLAEMDIEHQIPLIEYENKVLKDSVT